MVHTDIDRDWQAYARSKAGVFGIPGDTFAGTGRSAEASPGDETGKSTTWLADSPGQSPGESLQTKYRRRELLPPEL